MRIKKLFVCIIILCLIAILPAETAFTVKAAESDEKRVFDQAGLLTGRQTDELEERLEEAVRQMDMDLAVLTTDSTDGKTTEQYADDFYEEMGFGLGKDHSGALCVVDMDNRTLHISTEGAMLRVLTDERMEKILNRAITYMGNEAYLDGINGMISEIESYVDSGIVAGQFNSDRDTGKVTVYRKPSISRPEALFAFLAAGAIAFLTCELTVKEYKMNSERRQALKYHMAYKGSSSFAFSHKNDLFINRVVSKRRLPQNPPRNSGGGSGGSASSGRSTVHRSSSGRTHGGGGKGF